MGRACQESTRRYQTQAATRHTGRRKERRPESNHFADGLDPFVNFAMGRSYWLDGGLDSSLTWLERSTSICPNYAQGICGRAWSEALGGRAADSRLHVDLAMRLSPPDLLYYAMLGTRALRQVAVGKDEEAASWAERGGTFRPGAHVRHVTL